MDLALPYRSESRRAVTPRLGFAFCPYPTGNTGSVRSSGSFTSKAFRKKAV